jgi:hypothetical protein
MGGRFIPEALLLIAIMGDLSGGVASELEETITVLVTVIAP